MLIQPLQVSPWQSNCYLVTASQASKQCIIIDPGVTSAEPVKRAVEERGLIVEALVATHGHFDHIGDAHLLAAHYGVPLAIAEADRHLITDPGAGLGPQGSALLVQLTGSTESPAINEVIDYEQVSRIAGLRISAFAAPGHTAGSVLLTVSSPEVSAVFSGDVLFAGSIGRTDLPGGSMSEMRDSLRRIKQHFDPELAFLPGHGQPTTLARELATNPYLQPDYL